MAAFNGWKCHSGIPVVLELKQRLTEGNAPFDFWEMIMQHQFRASAISKVPHTTGLYAWYYKPCAFDQDSIKGTFTSILNNPIEVSNSIQMRYGMRYISTSQLSLVFGHKQQGISDVINEVIATAGEFLSNFFKSDAVQTFTRPIYIGIAKDLYSRVYDQHYCSLITMWEDASPVSKYLSINSDATVQGVMDNLGIRHSFALEARVRQIVPMDLIVHVYPTESLPKDIGPDVDDPQCESAARRALETLL
jgi:hypothetical protein